MWLIIQSATWAESCFSPLSESFISTGYHGAVSTRGWHPGNADRSPFWTTCGSGSCLVHRRHLCLQFAAMLFLLLTKFFRNCSERVPAEDAEDVFLCFRWFLAKQEVGNHAYQDKKRYGGDVEMLPIHRKSPLLMSYCNVRGFRLLTLRITV